MSGANRERLNVLAVEDDASDAILLKRYGNQVVTWELDITSCETASEALAHLGRTRFDVVFLDYHLGQDNGMTVLGAIRQSGHQCPVIFLTGAGDEQLAVEAMRAGATDYLSKNALSVNSLSRAVANAVEKSRLQRLIQDHQRNLEKANADLQRRNGEIQSFYHTVSHELRTPLTSTKEFIAIILDGLAGPITDQQREYLEIAAEGCQQMNGCIDDLLDVTRFETGKMSLQRVADSIADVIEGTVEAMAPLARDREIRIETKIADEGLPPVHIDAARITQVLRNLLSNAIKFSPNGSTIGIEARLTDDEDQVAVTVSDQGCGIPRDHLDRVFDRLHQVKSDDFSIKGGLGLGLNLCRQLIELHDGRIEVESEVGVGTRFTFTVPLAPDSAPAPHSEEPMRASLP